MNHYDQRSALSIGGPFPEMVVETTYGKMTLPNEFKGKWFVLFSHPGDFTPVCTTEFVAFQQLAPEFAKLQTALIGLSIDQVQPHMKWTEWIADQLGTEITFPIIADPLGTVAIRLGMLHAMTHTRTVRGVYIVDDRGIIRAMFFYPAEIGRNLNEILRTVYALQTADAYEVALPANWPDNELIGQKGILPPAATIDQKNERIRQAEAGEIECFDWWFCYKNIRNKK